MDISFDEDYVERLRAVFELCDVQKQGFITVGHFVDLAKEHFGGEDEDLNDIVTVLDSEGDGRIYFGDFCRGVKQITNLTGPGTPTSPIGSPRYSLNHIGSEETLVPVEEDANSSGTHETSEISTYNEYDMMTDEDNGLSAPSDSNNHSPAPGSASPEVNHRHPLPVVTESFIGSEDDVDSALSGKSSDIRRDQDVSEEEERFEDFGQAEEFESETDSHGTPAKVHSGEPVKKARHRDRRDWLRPRRPQGTSRRVTTSALASQLFRGVGASTGASRRSSCSDEVFDDIDGNLMELNDKVKRLEGQIGNLSEHQNKSEEKHLRMKEENSILIERIHTLEEQLRDVEVKGSRSLEEERRKQREYTTRTDKDKSQELELLRISLQHIEREYQTLKEEAPRLRAEVDRLRKENVNLDEKCSESQYQLIQMAEENQETQDRARGYSDDMVQERHVHGQLLDELTKELEELRAYKVETEGRARSHSQSPADLKMAHRRELELKVVRLKEENAKLRETNEDLHAQLLNSRIEEGRTLLQNGAQASLAAELESLPRDELMQALKEQQDANKKLSEYIDKIMLQIIEKDPSILEVNHNKPNSKSKNKTK